MRSFISEMSFHTMLLLTSRTPALKITRTKETDEKFAEIKGMTASYMTHLVQVPELNTSAQLVALSIIGNERDLRNNV